MLLAYIASFENHGTYIGFLADRVVNDIVVLDNLFLGSVDEILHASLLLLQIDVAETTVESDFASVKLEEQTQLRIVNHGVSAEIEEGVVEIGQGLFEIAEKEIGDALLKVGDGKVLVEANGSLIAFDLEACGLASERATRVVADLQPFRARRAWHG